jgi:dodecin
MIVFKLIHYNQSFKHTFNIETTQLLCIYLLQSLHLNYLMTHIAKVVEIIGSSDKGWEDAAQVAVDEAKKTLHGIHGIEIIDMTAVVDPNSGKIIQYRAAVKVAFAVEH